jgi:sulfotransferase
MIYFLSGLPRSGSTVLAAILNQNPKLHVTATSGLLSIMGAVAKQWDTDITIHTQGRDDTEFHRMLKGLMDAKYATIDKPIVIDKNRDWPSPIIMRTMEKVLGEKPKIIATVRNVPDCVASFVRVSKPENVQQFLQSTHLVDVIKASYQTLFSGMKENPECFCLVEYEDLLQNPQLEINKIHGFLGL